MQALAEEADVIDPEQRFAGHALKKVFRENSIAIYARSNSMPDSQSQVSILLNVQAGKGRATALHAETQGGEPKYSNATFDL